MQHDDPRHGTEAGHEQHYRDGETPCDASYEAKLRAARRRTKRKTMGHRYTVPIGQELHDRLRILRARGATHDQIAEWAGVSPSQAWRCSELEPDAIVYARTHARLTNMRVPERIVTPIGITRRLRALTWLGYSSLAIARETGVHFDTIRDCIKEPREFMARKVTDAIVETYDRLECTPAAGATKQEKAGVTRAKRAAERHGWQPPAAWDDIDDPKARPHTRDDRTKYDVDHVVVDRVLNGERLKTTYGEKLEVMRRATERGIPYRQICSQMGWKEGRYTPGEAA